MCLLVLAWRAHPRYRLVVAANRDEFHDRAAAPLAPWLPPAQILAGRDLRAGGAWLALDRARRFGVVTNYREAQRPRANAPSRGDLIPRFLAGGASAAEFFAQLGKEAAAYSGFNLLLADRDALWYGSNRTAPFARQLLPGVHGLSNELLDTPWPKLERVRAGFQSWLQAGTAAGSEQLFRLLADRVPGEPPSSAGGALPREWASALSAPFVLHPQYGTRCSTVLLLAADGQLQLTERRFDAAGQLSCETEFRLQPHEWP